MLGVAWACWHLPLYTIDAGDQERAPLAAFLISVVALSVVYTWFWTGTSGSLFDRRLLHAVVVLGVTAILVNTIPGRTAIMSRDSVSGLEAIPGPFSTQLHTAQVRIDVGLDPAMVGPNDVNIYTLTRGGAAQDVEELRARITLPTGTIEPLEVPLQRVGPGHLASYAFSVPSPGQWLLEVTARTSAIDQSIATTPVPIR